MADMYPPTDIPEKLPLPPPADIPENLPELPADMPENLPDNLEEAAEAADNLEEAAEPADNLPGELPDSRRLSANSTTKARHTRATMPAPNTNRAFRAAGLLMITAFRDDRASPMAFLTDAVFLRYSSLNGRFASCASVSGDFF